MQSPNRFMTLSFSLADWTCMKGVAKNNAFGTCISTEGSKVGDKARCG